jgi:protein-disulfide isomerase
MEKRILLLAAIICLHCGIFITMSEIMATENGDSTNLEAVNESAHHSLENEDETFADHLQAMEFDEKNRLREFTIGHKNAPITVVIYFSFTCDHCRKFHTVDFPKFKKDYIDSGKVKVHLRCYLDDPASLDAAILARCLAHNPQQPSREVSDFRKIMLAVFAVQDEWFRKWEMSSTNGEAKNAEKAARRFLDNIFIKLNYSKDKIEACKINDQSTADRHKWFAGLMMEQKRAMCEFHIESVPAFVIYNGKSKLLVHQGILTNHDLAKLCGLEH